MVLCTGKKEENVLPGSAKSYKGRNYQVVLLGVNVCGAECKVVFFFICRSTGKLCLTVCVCAVTVQVGCRLHTPLRVPPEYLVYSTPPVFYSTHSNCFK